MFYRQMLFPEERKKAVGCKQMKFGSYKRDFLLPIGKSNKVTSVLSLEFPKDIR